VLLSVLRVFVVCIFILFSSKSQVKLRTSEPSSYVNMSLTDVEKVNPSVESEDVNHIEAIERDADQTEHEETFFQALRKYPKIDLWCCFGLWVLTLASYDSYAGGIAVGIPEFRKVFGTNFEGTWILPANWLSAFSGVPQATSVSTADI
jgi:hypothetical protein